MSAHGTMPPPPAPSTCWAPPVASSRSPPWHTPARASPAAKTERRIEAELFFMAASRRHDVALHRGEDPQELVLLRVLHTGLLERLAQPLHHEVHLRFGVLQ